MTTRRAVLPVFDLILFFVVFVWVWTSFVLVSFVLVSCIFDSKGKMTVRSLAEAWRAGIFGVVPRRGIARPLGFNCVSGVAQGCLSLIV